MKTSPTAAVVVAAALAASAPALLRAQAVERAVFVGVVDQKGAPVRDLGTADFVVREDGQAREVLSVRPATEPMHIAVLIDNSQAGGQYVRDYREAVPAFIRAMTEGGLKHQFAIITVAERPTIITDFTPDPAQAIKGAERVFSFSGSGTYLLDGILETSQGMAKRRPERAVIVAITTEGPELSNRQHQDVLEPLALSGAALHVLALGRPVNNDQERAIALDRGTKDTGGRFQTVLTGNALTGRLRQLAEELRSQYRVTYARPRRLIPPKDIDVETPRTGLTVRATPAVPPREEVRP